MWMFILGLRFYCFLLYLRYIIIILYILITLSLYLSCLGYWYYNNTVHSSSVTNTHKHQPTLWHAVWLAVPTCLSSIYWLYIVLLSPDNCNCLSIVVAQCTECTVQSVQCFTLQLFDWTHPYGTLRALHVDVLDWISHCPDLITSGW